MYVIGQLMSNIALVVVVVMMAAVMVVLVVVVVVVNVGLAVVCVSLYLPICVK